jgi:hypothetical protein
MGATVRTNLMKRAEYAIASGRLTLLGMRFESFLRKYDPSQPRVPAGQSTGGQWTDEGTLVAGTYNEANRDKCELQYETDMFQCRFVTYWRNCQSQAMVRLVACMKGDPLPPFNY